MIRLILLITLLFSSAAFAENQQEIDRVELKTSFIKGNKELPQVLYIVPWQTIKQGKKKTTNMVLHSLYGNIFQPVTEQEFK